MSIIKIASAFRDITSVVTHPSRSFQSASIQLNKSNREMSYPYEGTGITGSLAIVARGSKIVKDFPTIPLTSFPAEDGSFLPFVAADSYGPYYFADLIKSDPRFSVDGVISDPTLPGGGADISGPVEIYMNTVNERAEQPKNNSRFNIRRFRPPYKLDQAGKGILGERTAKDLGKKKYIVNTLMPKYRHRYTNSQLSYTNYNCLNFFTGSGQSAQDRAACLIYPNFTGTLDRTKPDATFSVRRSREEVFALSPFVDLNPGGHAGRGPYTTTGSFTFSFYINPKQTVSHPAHFHAGTIMHLSSTYAVSLVSGSKKDAEGKLQGYRILLQLTHSADAAPQMIRYSPGENTGSSRQSGGAFNSKYPYNHIYLSDDNSLKHNHWHHVAIRWGTNRANAGSGSFIIDGVERGTFNVPSASISLNLPTNATPASGPTRRVGGSSAGISGPHRNLTDPDAMIIGNFYEGDNAGDTGTAIRCSRRGKLILFFDAYGALYEGLEPAFPGKQSDGTIAMTSTSGKNMGFKGAIPANPAQSKGEALFRHPLNAELHDVRIYDTMRDTSDILSSSVEGPKDFTDMLFYLPVMFVKSSGKYPRVAAGSCGSPVFQRWTATVNDDGIFPDVAPKDFVYFHQNDRRSHLNRPACLTEEGAIYSGTYLERPFNAGLSNNIDATNINLENFCMDFVTKKYPKLLMLTESIAATSNGFLSTHAPYYQGGMQIGKVNYASNILADDPTGDAQTKQPYIFNGLYWNSSEIPTAGSGFFPGNAGDKSSQSGLDYLYATSSLCKRNLTILPCDNGLFRPNFELLLSGNREPFITSSASPMSLFIDADTRLNLSTIFLENIFQTDGLTAVGEDDSKYYALTHNITGSPPICTEVIDAISSVHSVPPLAPPAMPSLLSFITSSIGDDEDTSWPPGQVISTRKCGSGNPDYLDIVSPDNPDGLIPGVQTNPHEVDRSSTKDVKYSFLSYQLTGDPSSNEVSIFEISNLFYGMQIEPASFSIEDKFITGSAGRVSIKLKDDRYGGLYRADARTPHAKWNNVGNIFYNEGIVIVKSPHLAHFGKDFFRTEFMGEQNVHVSSLGVLAPEGMINSSSNPTYTPLSASLNANDTEPFFTYVTSINLHDENLNIVARANLAQPILKRFVEGYLFRLKMDY